MIIAIDYDGTITPDPSMWINIARIMQSRGNLVYIVTMRYPSECDAQMRSILPYFSGVIFTERRAKRPFVEQHHMLKVDIWIDDHPQAVDFDAAQVWGEATPPGEVSGIRTTMPSPNKLYEETVITGVDTAGMLIAAPYSVKGNGTDAT